MTSTPYCSTDQWAVRHGYDDWDKFAAAESWPSETQLEQFLIDATVVMNDLEHIATGTNITSTSHTERLEIICFNIANRMLDEMNARGSLGGQMFTTGAQNWSGADYMMTYERTFLLRLSKISGKRVRGKIVF